MALFATAAALRLPLAPLGETVEEALDPIASALAFRDHLHIRPPPFFHFGYGRGLSWVPLVLGQPDGLLGVALRRGLVQALVAPGVYLAGRRFVGSGSGRALAPALFALLLGTNEDFLHTGISGHESYMAAEWLTVALLAATLLSRWPRRASLLLGGALAMAVMNHPLAIPALVLLLLPRSGRARLHAAAAAGGLLLPQVLRAGAALWAARLGDLPQRLLPLPGAANGGRLSEVLHVFSGASHLDVAVLMAAIPVAVWTLWQTAHRRLATLGAAAAGLALLEVAVAGSSQGWYWRPLAPWMAVLGAVTLARPLASRQVAQGLAAGVACWIAITSVSRAAGAYDDQQDGLQDTGHITLLARFLEKGTVAGPWAIRGMAGPGGRAHLLPLALDLQVAGRTADLRAHRPAALKQPTLLHIEGEPELLGSLWKDWAGHPALLASGHRFVILLFPAGRDALGPIDRICRKTAGQVSFDDTQRWTAALGQASEAWVDCSSAADSAGQLTQEPEQSEEGKSTGDRSQNLEP